MSGSPVNERALLLPLDGKAPDPLVEPFGHVEIAVRTDRKAGRGLELAIDHHARLELAARCRFGDVVGKDAAGAGGADVERVAMQDEMHGLRELLPGDARHEPPCLQLVDLDDVPCFARHIEMLAMHDDAAHGVPGSAMHVEHHLEALRRRDIDRRVVTGFRESAQAGGDQRAGEEVAVGEALAKVRGHRRGLSRLRQDGEDGVGVLAGDVEAAVVAEFYVEGVDHRRYVFRGHHHLGEAEHVAVAAITSDVAVFAPGVGDVEIVADQREAARNVQRVRLGRRIEQQRVLLAWCAVVLEDADVFDAGLAFTSIADPPHDVLPSLLRRFPNASVARAAPVLECEDATVDPWLPHFSSLVGQRRS